MGPPHADARSPGTTSTWSDHRHDGQWLRYEPVARARTCSPHRTHSNAEFSDVRLMACSCGSKRTSTCRHRGHVGSHDGRFGPAVNPGLDGGGTRFTAVPLGSAITSDSCFTVVSQPRIRTSTGVFWFVPATVTQLAHVTSQVPSVGVVPSHRRRRRSLLRLPRGERSCALLSLARIRVWRSPRVSCLDLLPRLIGWHQRARSTRRHASRLLVRAPDSGR